MSARTRLLIVIAVAALVAVTAVVVIARGSDHGNGSGAREGAPPLALDLGLRSDAEASALRRAVKLYDGGQRRAAGGIFTRYSSPAAQVGAAFAGWPDGTVAELEGLAGQYPRDALVLLNLGLARFWSGDDNGAAAAWLTAYDAQPDSPSALTADFLLHPNTPSGIPIFVPGFAAPAAPSGSAAEQLQQLRRNARRRDVHARLIYGIALQRIGRQRSAERAYAAAARIAPDDPEAQVAVAVARFSRGEPARAFSKLGPLTRRFPKAATVRFHLGLLLAWLGRIDAAKAQFARASRLDRKDPLARQAAKWLAVLQHPPKQSRTRSPGK